MTFSIRAAGVADLRQIKEIDTYIFEEDAYPVFVLRQLLDITAGLMKVATVGDEVAGYAIGHHDKETREAWFLSAGVLPDYRGFGIGQSLLKALVEEMVAKDTQAIFLTVQPKNTAGINLYEKLGFKTFQTHHDYYLDGLPRLLMKRDLKEARH